MVFKVYMYCTYVIVRMSLLVSERCMEGGCMVCVCVSRTGVVTVRPFNTGALCYVNGKLIVDETLLKTGNRVIFGKSHVFRFTNPQQGACVRAASSTVSLESVAVCLTVLVIIVYVAVSMIAFSLSSMIVDVVMLGWVGPCPFSVASTLH